MKNDIRMRVTRRKDIDEEKLAFAFLLLAKILNEQTYDSDAKAKDEPRGEAA